MSGPLWKITRNERGKVVKLVHPYKDAESMAGEEWRAIYALVAQAQRETEEAVCRLLLSVKGRGVSESFVRGAIERGEHFKED